MVSKLCSVKVISLVGMIIMTRATMNEMIRLSLAGPK